MKIRSSRGCCTGPRGILQHSELRKAVSKEGARLGHLQPRSLSPSKLGQPHRHLPGTHTPAGSYDPSSFSQRGATCGFDGWISPSNTARGTRANNLHRRTIYKTIVLSRGSPFFLVRGKKNPDPQALCIQRDKPADPRGVL